MPSKSSELKEEDVSSDVDMDEPTSHQPAIKDDDADMMEQDDEENQEGVDDYEEEEEPQRVKLVCAYPYNYHPVCDSIVAN